MHFLKIFKNLHINKTKVREEPSLNFATFIEYAPPEIFEEIFSKVQIKDVLKCRLLCKTIRFKIHQHYSSKLKVVLEDKKYKRLSRPMTICLDILNIKNLVSTSMTPIFVKNSFAQVQIMDISGPITTTSFYLLVQEMPRLINLTLHSLTLGGPLNFHELNMKTKKSNIPLRKLQLHLDYIPITTKGFSSLQLITNLRELKFWNLKFLNSIYFRVEASTFNEQFYFGFHTFLSSIPIQSYRSLQNLKISCPKLKPENPNTHELVKTIFKQIQFKNLELRFQNVKHASKPDHQISTNTVLHLANDLGLNAHVIVNNE